MHNIDRIQDIHASGGIRTRIPSKRAAADKRLRSCGRWDRLLFDMGMKLGGSK